MSNFPAFETFFFDTEKIDLKTIFFDFMDNSQINSFLLNTDDSVLYKKFYNIVQGKNFQIAYKKLIKIMNTRISEDFYYQTVPSIRIQKPSKNSVNYHSDSWYGHGNEIINAWVPLTELNTTNTLHLLNKKDSELVTNRFIKEKLSINAVNEISSNLAKPFLGEYGTGLLFNSTILHGTSKNESLNPRLSFDFRIVIKGKNSGSKTLNEFFTPNFKLNDSVLRNCTAIMYTSGFFSNLSHQVQREIIQFYCLKKSLVIEAEETEIHGVNHYPASFFYISEKDKPIVFTSVMILPQEFDLREKLLLLIIKNNLEVHFALENIKFKQSLKTKIHKYFTDNFKNKI